MRLCDMITRPAEGGRCHDVADEQRHDDAGAGDGGRQQQRLRLLVRLRRQHALQCASP